MEKEYLDRKTNSSTTKHSFGSGLLGKDGKETRVAQLFRRFIFLVPNHFSNFSPRASIKFVKSRFKNKKIIGVEIGVLLGNHAKAILKTLPTCQLYLIDSYECDEKSMDSYRSAKKRLKKYNDRITWIIGKSVKVYNQVPNNLDFIYFDSLHAYEHVKKELKLYSPKVRNGGVLCGHDFQKGGVAKAVIEFANENKLETPQTEGFPVDWWTVWRN